MKRPRHGARAERATAAADLARRLAESAARHQRGEPVSGDTADLQQLLNAVIADDDGEGLSHFFAALGTELTARGVDLPSLDQLPPNLAALLAVADASLVPGPDGDLDLDATATRLDDAVAALTGTSPRRAREEADHTQLRSEIAASVADSLRRHGLTPACDMPADDDGDDGR